MATTQSAENEMERAHVIVCKVLKETHTIKIEVAIVNVKIMMIVMIVWHVSHTNVLIHALAFAVNRHCVMYQNMFQHVLARLV